MRKFTYIIAYLVLMALPAGIFAYFVRDALDLKVMVMVLIVGLLIGGFFDIWATRQGKKDKFFIWEYNVKTTLGYKFFGVPVEDFFLFFVLTPFLIITIWEFMKKAVILRDIPLAGVIAFSSIALLLVYSLAIRIARKKVT